VNTTQWRQSAGLIILVFINAPLTEKIIMQERPGDHTKNVIIRMRWATCRFSLIGELWLSSDDFGLLRRVSTHASTFAVRHYHQKTHFVTVVVVECVVKSVTRRSLPILKIASVPTTFSKCSGPDAANETRDTRDAPPARRLITNACMEMVGCGFLVAAVTEMSNADADAWMETRL